MKRFFIVILLILNTLSIATAQVSQLDQNDDIEYVGSNLITPTQLSITQNKSFIYLNFSYKTYPSITCEENNEFVHQILKKILFTILKANDPPKYFI